MKPLLSLFFSVLIFSSPVFSQNNNALSYDGIDDYVEIDDTELLSGGTGKSFTVEAWINLGSLGDNRPIISKFLSARTKDWGLQVNTDGTLQVDIENSGDNWAYNAGNVSPGVWSHVAFTFDNPGDVVRLYINGGEVGTGGALTQNMPNSTAPVRFGSIEYNSKFFDGDIDEIRIWDYARSETELQSAMNSVLTGAEAGLIGYWQFDEGSGQTTADLSGNNQTGQLGSTSGSDGSDPAWAISGAPLGADDTPPVISNVSAGSLTEDSANINWDTDEASDSQLEYGPDTNYGTVAPLDPTLVTNHAVFVGGLNPNTIYHYRVLSRDAAGNLATGADNTFTTLAPDVIPPIISTVSANNVTSNSADINWDTNEAGDSQVEYGLDTNYGTFTTLDPTLVTGHSVNLNGLNSNTIYHYRVLSRDAAGNLATSADFSFTTLEEPGGGAGFTLNYDGIDDFVDIADTDLLSGGTGKSLTVEAWINVASLPDVSPVVTKFPNARDKDWGLIVKTNGAIQVDIENSGDNWAYTAGSVPIGIWTHVAFTFDNGSDLVRLFVNGLEVGTGVAFTNDMPNTSATIRFGNSNYNGKFFSGEIDEIRIWDYARSETELQSAMNSVLTGGEAGLIGFWRCDEGSGQTTADLSGNNQTGQLGSTSGSDGTDPVWAVSGAPLGADDTPPVITNVSAGSMTENSANINWDTNEASDSQVEYGPDLNYGTLTALDPPLVTSHSAGLSGLSSNTTYHYRVLSRDAAGNLATGADNTFATLAPDVTPPIISTVSANNITSNSADINWDTDEAGDSQVEYGLDTNYGTFTTLDPTLVTGHSVNLNGLNSNTIYHYRVLSRDAAGNLATSADFSFITLDESGGGAGFTLNYDGLEDYVDIADTDLLGGGTGKSLTVEAWINVASLPDVSPVATKFLNARDKDWGLIVKTNGAIQVDIENNGDNWAYTAGSVPIGIWTHVAFTFDNGSDLVRLFVNGLEVGTAVAFTNDMPNTSATIRFGNSNYNGKFFSGDIDEIRIWDYARSETELQSAMNSVLTGGEAGLIGFWRFDEGSGQTTADISGNGNVGQLGSTSGSDGSDPAWAISGAPLGADDTPPVVSNVAAGSMTENSANINWDTNEAADTQVEYGLDTSYGSLTLLDAVLVLNHNVGLSGLTSTTLYHYRVLSRDASGNLTVGGDQTFTTLTPDVTPPIISTVSANNVTSNSADINWDTDEAGDSQVEYGLDTNYGTFSPLDPTLTASHDISLTGLSETTTYHYRVHSRDDAGNLATSGDNTFTTLEEPDGGSGFALSFDGINDFAEIGDTDLLSGGSGKSITVEAWVNLTSLGDNRPIVNKFLSASTKDWGLQVNDNGSLQTDIENSGDNWSYNAGSLGLGVWTHVAFTFDNPGDVVRLYINGGEVGTGGALTKNMPNSIAPVRFGSIEYNSKFIDGEIDEIRIWDYARSEAEIQSTMNSILSGAEAGLTGYWRFDEGSGQTAFDLTTNSNNAQLGSTSGSDGSDPTWIAIAGDPFVTVSYPNGGETLLPNTIAEINWLYSPLITDVMVEFSSDGGASWTTVVANTPNTGSYDWTVPNTESDNCLIRISDAADADPIDASDAVFTIVDMVATGALVPNLKPWIGPNPGGFYDAEIRVEEGETRLAFSATTASTGGGPLNFVWVDETNLTQYYQRIYNPDSSFQDIKVDTAVFEPGSTRPHYPQYAVFRLRTVNGDGSVGAEVAGDDKIGWCLGDSDPYDLSLPGASTNAIYACPIDNQGISVGWGDVYGINHDGQWIVIDDVPDGEYWLELEVNPNKSLVELDMTDNTEQVKIEFNKSSQTVTILASALSSAFERRVNVGGPALHLEGKFWQADQPYHEGLWGYVEGRSHQTADKIDNTSDGKRYQTVRTGLSAYRFTVPKERRYKVNLYFVEISLAERKQRIFDVLLENTRVLDNFDVYASTGHDAALRHSYEIDVTDGLLDIVFESEIGEPTVSAIEVVELAPLSDLVQTSGHSPEINIPTEFSLKQNYPNPFNITTQIKYDLPAKAKVQLQIFNLKGQVVRTLLKEEIEAGRHNILWDGKNELGAVISSGIYIYQINAGGWKDSKKMTVVK